MTRPRISSRSGAAAVTAGTETGFAGAMRDSHGRAITDLRISVTDRCNYRCVYCRTGNEGAVYSELSLAEYSHMLRLFVGLGIEKIRFTGGEPLLRKGLTELIAETAEMGRSLGRTLDLALTTNGHLLAPMAQELKAAGLNRITVSMDAVDPETFARITRVPNGFDRVRAGIRAAQDAGLGPVKVNCVLMRGFNDDQIEAFARVLPRRGRDRAVYRVHAAGGSGGRVESGGAFVGSGHGGSDGGDRGAAEPCASAGGAAGEQSGGDCTAFYL